MGRVAIFTDGCWLAWIMDHGPDEESDKGDWSCLLPCPQTARDFCLCGSIETGQVWGIGHGLRVGGHSL